MVYKATLAPIKGSPESQIVAVKTLRGIVAYCQTIYIHSLKTRVAWLPAFIPMCTHSLSPSPHVVRGKGLGAHKGPKVICETNACVASAWKEPGTEAMQRAHCFFQNLYCDNARKYLIQMKFT